MSDDPDQVFAADVGSVPRGRFGWHGPTGSGSSPDELVDAVAEALSPKRLPRRVALGFECPTYVPVHRETDRLGGMRPVDRRQGRAMPWSAAAGTSALATGLVQAAWILDQLSERLPDVSCTVVPDRWTPRTLLLWEAFISGAGKAIHANDNPHTADALVAVKAFHQLQMAGLPSPATYPDHRQLNLLAAAAQWARMPIQEDELWMPTLVAPQA